MINKSFLRWSAGCVITGALILTLGYLLRTDIEKEFIDEFASTRGFISSIMVAAGSLLFLAGLPAVFLMERLYASKSGIVASTLSFIGIAAFHVGTLALYFVLPVLVTHNAATRGLVYSDEPPFPRFAIFWALSLLIQVTGLVWMGIKTLGNSRSRNLTAALLIAGALVFLAAPFIYFPLIKPANTLVMLGFVLAAIPILRSKTNLTS